MKFRIPVKYLLITSLLTASGTGIAQEETSGLEVEGMQLVEDSNLAMVYAQPDTVWRQYSKIRLDKPVITFKENRQREQNRDKPGWISDEDLSRIKTELSVLFMDVFSKSLLEGGYELVTETGEDVLLIRPAITSLDIIAAETNSRATSITFSESAGEITLSLELYDSVTGEMLARALDRQVDRQTGYFGWQNHITNRAAARRIVTVWADVLKEGLDDAWNSPPG